MYNTESFTSFCAHGLKPFLTQRQTALLKVQHIYSPSQILMHCGSSAVYKKLYFATQLKSAAHQTDTHWTAGPV